jgi:hypothetical protein
MATSSYFNEPSYEEQVFDEDLLDVHLSYDYDAEDAEGNSEKWHYELWFPFKVSFAEYFSISPLTMFIGPLRVQDSWRSNGRSKQFSDL